ncbi:MAG: 50S ribosomal protein L21 [Mycoplasmataceae bacterium]|jgi:large subunit ribosomal protein L21|nr:50S ribosomal protein L21 [Mycoplasmataceae bacterium]
MFAIISVGGKQYKVSQDSVIYVEKIEQADGSDITINEVLMVDEKIGQPYVEGAKVVCTVDKQIKGEKLDIIHHRPQKHHTKRMGHRQKLTKLTIKSISL